MPKNTTLCARRNRSAAGTEMAPDAMGRVLVRSGSDEVSRQPKIVLLKSDQIKPHTDLAIKVSVANIVPDASNIMANSISNEVCDSLDGDRLRREV